ncbi:MAG: HlyD family efflux transporter periplasmic adaptor subunit [Anaerolineaceae bacterium]|nr:HlyD family efflux transporter periplasmic adaptor subunit [Anaerolineaceae bacterium]
MKKTLPILLIILSLVLGACVQAQADPSKGSGYLSANSVAVAPELSGKVTEVLVEEGDYLKEGDVLLRLDDEILKAQYAQAQAAQKTAESAMEVVKTQVQNAQLQYDLARDAAHAEDVQNRMKVLGTKSPDDYRPSWYFQKNEVLEAAENTVQEALKELEKKQASLNAELEKTNNQDFVAIEKHLAEEELNWTIAKQTLEQAKLANSKNLSDAAQKLADQAESSFKSALKEYDNALNSKDAEAVLEARSQVSVAKSKYDFARDQLLSLQTGDQSLKISLAKGVLDQANAGLVQAKNAVAQADAALKLLELQLSRSELKAPSDGTVLTVNLKAGEVVTAGGTAFTLASLDKLTLEVYLPEDYYGKVKMGDSVNISSDSFPNRTFSGKVLKIADQAEFTPRNIQTVDGRSSSVYKISIEVPNASRELKPGMPVDVQFK